MANEPMELAINYKEGKTPMPALAELKVDGVPVTFEKDAAGLMVTATSRQGKPVKSVQHIIDFMKERLPPGGLVTMECTVPGLSFKDASGIIRRQTPDADTAKIIGYIWDGDVYANNAEYVTRMSDLSMWLINNPCPFLIVAARVMVRSTDDIELLWKCFKERSTGPIEGLVLHDPHKLRQPGKRCWGMGRWKPQPTIDLQVTSYEEAVSENGTGLGMVGRVNVDLRRRFPNGGVPDGWTLTEMPDVWRTTVGIGPGRLSHAERKALWEGAWAVHGRSSRVPAIGMTLAEIKYMPDPDYSALRQPTVQRLRHDKTEGDILEY